MSPPTTDLSDEERVIHVNDGEELHYWRKRFNCTEQMLRDAVHRVGASVHDVKRYLGIR